MFQGLDEVVRAEGSFDRGNKRKSMDNYHKRQTDQIKYKSMVSASNMS